MTAGLKSFWTGWPYYPFLCAAAAQLAWQISTVELSNRSDCNRKYVFLSSSIQSSLAFKNVFVAILWEFEFVESILCRFVSNKWFGALVFSGILFGRLVSWWIYQHAIYPFCIIYWWVQCRNQNNFVVECGKNIPNPSLCGLAIAGWCGMDFVSSIFAWLVLTSLLNCYFDITFASEAGYFLSTSLWCSPPPVNSYKTRGRKIRWCTIHFFCIHMCYYMWKHQLERPFFGLFSASRI